MSTLSWKEFESHGEKLLDRVKTPAAVVSVAEGGRTAYTHGFGYRDVEKTTPPDDRTIFGIGSITKSFTAVAITQLQEKRKLATSDPVRKYIPEFRYGKFEEAADMTIHHFLTHTSGLPPLPFLNQTLVRSVLKDLERKEGPTATGKALAKELEQKERLKSIKPIDNYDQLLEALASVDVPLLGSPGEYFSYSNDAYALLGLIVERVSGEKYEEYVERHILEPLGMEDSSFDSHKSANVALLYSSKRVKGKQVVFPSPVPWESPVHSAAGFLRSTARDMLRYLEVYRTGGTCGKARVLSEKSVEHMTTPYVRLPNGQCYGYGLMIHPNYRGVSLVEHGGNIKGVSAWAACAKEKGVTGIALTNLVSSQGADLVLGAMNVLLHVPVTSRRFRYSKFEAMPETLQRYAGLYASGEGSSIKVTVKDNSLEFESEGLRVRGRPVAVDVFAIRRNGSETTVHFICDKTGEPFAIHFGYRMIRRVEPKHAGSGESTDQKTVEAAGDEVRPDGSCPDRRGEEGHDKAGLESI